MRVIGYILFILGIVVTALSYPFIRTSVNVAPLLGLNDWYVMAAGIVLMLVGAMLAFGRSSRSRQAREVPIYHGRNVVGYRRN